MIEIQCVQQAAGNYDNPYEIQKILLVRADDSFRAVFVCETREIAETLSSAICRLRVLMKDYAVNRKLSFSVVAAIPFEDSGNCVVLKGNILDAVNALITQGILSGRNRAVFEDPEEEEIQIFLKDSAKKAITILPKTKVEGIFMIEIFCTQRDTMKNPYELEKILFVKEANHFYMALVCDKQSRSEQLWSAIDSLRTMIKGDAIDRRAGFSLGKISQIQTTLPPHVVVLKGDMQKAVDALSLNTTGALRGDNLAALQANAKVQAFLKESSVLAMAKSKGATSDEQEAENRSQSAPSLRHCTLF